MAKNYMGVNLTGRSLMHYRTKGSRNGYSKDPNYRPVGQRATGQIVNGRYVYDQGSKNNWQQQAAAARDDKETYTKYKEGKINAITAKDNSGDVTTMYHPKGPYGVNYTAIKTEKLGAASKGKKNNWQQAGNLTRSMTEVARDLRNREEAKAKGQKVNRYEYSNPSPLQRPGTKSAFNDKMLMKNSAKYASEAAGKAGSYRQRSEKASAVAAGYGTTNDQYRRLKDINRRQNPNSSIYAKAYGDTMQSVNAKVNSNFGRRAYSNNVEAGGAMRNDPRYSSKSVYLNKEGNKTVDKQMLAKAIGEGKHESLSKGMQRINKLDAARGSMNRSIRKAKQEVANTASKAYNTASKYASAAANKAKSAASSASKAASSAVETGKKTVDSLLNKFKKKKK